MMMREAFRIYYLDNGFLVVADANGDGESFLAFVESSKLGLENRYEQVTDLLYYIGHELLMGNAPGGTRLEIKTFSKYGGEE
jgi:hypothetical protein